MSKNQKSRQVDRPFFCRSPFVLEIFALNKFFKLKKMKKTIYPSYCLHLIVIACISFVSCSKDSNDNPSPTTDAIAVNLTIDVNGTLSNSPSIQYNDDKGERKTEVLSGDWTKTFSVNSGYKLFLKVKGTIDGTIGIKATAEGNGNSFNDDNNFGGSPKDFDHTIERTLD